MAVPESLAAINADSPGEVIAAVAKRRAQLWLLSLLGWPAAILLFLLLVVFAIAAITMGSLPSANSQPSDYAQRLIPANMLALYQSPVVRRECPGLSWTVVAAIIHLESRDGRDAGSSPDGAMGPSQFLPTTWDSQGRTVIEYRGKNGKLVPYGRNPDGTGYALDGDGDGIADINNPWDSVPATARMLCANGGGQLSTLVNAIYAYNHAWWYVLGGIDDAGNKFIGVLPLAKELAANGNITGDTSANISLAGSLGGGIVTFAPGANLPGQPVTPETMSFLQEVAGIYGKPLICTTGTNHSYYTTDGLVSDHASGHACDFGMAANGGTDDGPVGDAIATACLIAAGDPPAVASQEANVGGLYTRDNGGLRIQCIWKTDEGGNHHNHVHIGARPG